MSDQELASLKVNVKLDRFGLGSARHNRAASILGSFYQFLEDEGRKILAREILLWIEDKDEDKLFELANHLVVAILLPRKPIPRSPVNSMLTCCHSSQGIWWKGAGPRQSPIHLLGSRRRH